MYTEIQVTAKKLNPLCVTLLREIISTVLFLFNVRDFTVGTKEVSEEDLIKEAENG